MDLSDVKTATKETVEKKSDEDSHPAVPEPKGPGGSGFELVIHPGRASDAHLRRLFSSLSKLNRALGGNGVDWCELPEDRGGAS